MAYEELKLTEENASLLNGRESKNYVLLAVDPTKGRGRYTGIVLATKEQCEDIFSGRLSISMNDVVRVYDILGREDRFDNYTASTAQEVLALYVLYHAGNGNSACVQEKIDVPYLTEILSMPGIGDMQDAFKAIDAIQGKTFIHCDYPSISLTKEGVKLMENVVAEVSRQDKLRTDFGNEIHLNNSSFNVLKVALPPVMAVLGAARKNDVKALHEINQKIESEVGPLPGDEDVNYHLRRRSEFPFLY